MARPRTKLDLWAKNCRGIPPTLQKFLDTFLGSSRDVPRGKESLSFTIRVKERKDPNQAEMPLEEDEDSVVRDEEGKVVRRPPENGA